MCHPARASFIRKKKHFCLLQPYLVWKYSLVQWNWSSVVTGCTWVTCISDVREPISLHQAVFVLLITKNKAEKFVAQWKVCQKSSQREVPGRMRTKHQNHKVSSSLRCISSFLGHWQTSTLPQQCRVLSSRKIDFHTTPSSRSQLEWSAGKPSTSGPANQTQGKTAYNSTVGRGDEGKRNFRGQKRQLFLQNNGFFEGSTASLVPQLHARGKWRRWGNHNNQKVRLEFTQVAIDRNRLMASQRVKSWKMNLKTYKKYEY